MFEINFNQVKNLSIRNQKEKMINEVLHFVLLKIKKEFVPQKAFVTST